MDTMEFGRLTMMMDLSSTMIPYGDRFYRQSFAAALQFIQWRVTELMVIIFTYRALQLPCTIGFDVCVPLEVSDSLVSMGGGIGFDFCVPIEALPCVWSNDTPLACPCRILRVHDAPGNIK
jgi:hypothetical protein